MTFGFSVVSVSPAFSSPQSPPPELFHRISAPPFPCNGIALTPQRFILRKIVTIDMAWNNDHAEWLAKTNNPDLLQVKNQYSTTLH
jgi:hypothetical protein